MKKIIYNFGIITSLVVILFSAPACNDFLDVPSHGTPEEEGLYQTIDDFDKVVYSVYGTLRSLANSKHISYGVMGDNLMQCADGRNSMVDLWLWRFSPDKTLSGLWVYYYGIINNMNKVINRLQSNEYSHFSSLASGKNILGEALIFRAISHFELVQAFGKSYSQASNSDLGVPYRKDSDYKHQARNTVKEVYQNIVNDIEAGLLLISSDYNSNINTRLNKKSAYALASRVYLTMAGDQNTGEYKGYLEKARDYASLAIKGNGSDLLGNMQLTTTNPAYTMWVGGNKNNSEFLLRLAVLTTDGYRPGDSWGQASTGSDWKNEVVATYSFMQMFTNTDIRLYAYLNQDSYDSKTYNGVLKYRYSAYQNIVDIPYVRTAEVYLNRAEACARLGDATNMTMARQDLVNLLAKRYTDINGDGNPDNVPYNTNDADLLHWIDYQRRVELAFEGFRWTDLKRLNLNLERDSRGDQANGLGVASSVTQILNNSIKWQLPIPTSEMTTNPNMVQNPL